MPEQPQVDQRAAGPQLGNGPPGEQPHRCRRAAKAGRGSPAPHRALGERQEQAGDPEPEGERTGEIQPGLAARARRQHRRACRQGQRAERGDEPERRGQAKVLGEQPNERVADPDPGSGGDADQRDRRPGTIGGQVVPGHGCGEGHQAKSRTLQRPAGQEHGKTAGQRRRRAAGQHERDAAQRGLAAQPPVAETPHDRGRDRPGEQRDRERPLRSGERHVVVPLDGGQQRRAKACHRRGLHRQEHQHRHQHRRSGCPAAGRLTHARHGDHARNEGLCRPRPIFGYVYASQE